jgi:putative acetyltransferase
VSEWDLVVAVDDPRRADAAALLQVHVEFAQGVTPAEHMHAVEADALAGPDVTFMTARRGGHLLGVGALKVARGHGELKSMHVRSNARGQGVAQALLVELLAAAHGRNLSRVSLVTGPGPAFSPARALYDRAGFTRCQAFHPYTDTEESVFMTLEMRR